MLKVLARQAFCLNKSFVRTLTERRLLSTSTTAQTAAADDQAKKPNQSGLFKLRKATGYGMSKCREALEKFNGNIEEASKWLDEQAQKEGWDKAEKLKNRQTSQGTLVFYKIDRLATILELNCETDFVAKNEKFLELSSNLAISVLQNAKPSHSKHILSKEIVNSLGYLNETSRTIGDQIALAIGSLGENMSINRAFVYNLSSEQRLSWYMHGSLSNPINNCHFGKYGAMVAFTQTKHNENYIPFEVGRQIAQHIVGMKPKSLGEIPVETASAESTDASQPQEIKLDENESRLLYQEFLMKPNTRVLDFAREQNIVINNFVRCECGGEIVDA